MRPKTFTVVGSTGGPTYSPVFVVDTYNNPCNIALGVVVSGNNTIADVQDTFADPGTTNLNVVSAAAWENNATLVSANSTPPNGLTSGNYAYPPRAIRLRVRALASAGAGEAATLTIQQTGPEN